MVTLLATPESPTKTESAITIVPEGPTVETNPEQTAEMQVENNQLQMTASSSTGPSNGTTDEKATVSSSTAQVKKSFSINKS